MARKTAAAPESAAPEKEFDVFADEIDTKGAPSEAAPEAAAPAPEAPKEEVKPEAKPKAAPKEKECNEGCPKFHRPDADCVKCFNENFKR